MFSQLTLRHLHQREVEHNNPPSSSIGKHFIKKHCIVPKDLDKQFFVLAKCKNKFESSVHKILLIRELAPSLDVHLDSVEPNYLREIT